MRRRHAFPFTLALFCIDLGAHAANAQERNDTLTLLIDGVSVVAAEGQSLTLYAGQAIQGLLLSWPTFPASSVHFKFVDAVDNAGVWHTRKNTLGADRITTPFSSEAGSFGRRLGNTSTFNASLGPEGFFKFRMGGSYRLCLSDNNFSSTTMLNVSLEVAGAFSPCTADDCLATKKHYCHGGGQPRDSCSLDFTRDGDGLSGGEGKVTLSMAWTALWDESTGSIQNLTAQSCGSTSPNNADLCWQSSHGEYGACNGSHYLQHDGMQNTFTLPQAPSSQAYTFTACYCPGLNSCNSAEDFVQQIGIVHFFVSFLCDPADSLCLYSGAVPKQGFTFVVHCPPSGCGESDNSRVKLIDFHPDNDGPSWDGFHACRTAEQTLLQEGPVNCDSFSTCELEGGLRQDRKAFGNYSHPLVLAGRGSDYEVRNFHDAKLLDWCFCLDNCSSSWNWFKVGQMSLSPYRVLGSVQPLTVNVPFSVGFYSDPTVLGLGPNSLVKLLLEEDSIPTSDQTCRTESSFSQVIGSGEASFRSEHWGHISEANPAELVFNGGDPRSLLTPIRAGVTAICYCRYTMCSAASDEWILAARVLVRGPDNHKYWSFSTGVAARLTYTGFGLSPSDTLRILQSDEDCSNGSPSDRSVLVGCPFVCTSSSKMQLATQPLDYATVGCADDTHPCETVYIVSITVLNESSTAIDFDGNPGLTTGDRILLGHGIYCGSNCSAEQIASIGGARSFVDGDNYSMEVTVTATRTKQRFIVQTGWSEPVPQFDIPGETGQWRRTSQASTAEEVMGTRDAESLTVCWSGGDGLYTARVGSVSFQTPPSMTAEVSLTASGRGVVAPLVISFTTGWAADYSSPVGSPCLKIIFLDVTILQPRTTDKGSLVETSRASQAVCGSLFLELASTGPAGFPMPAGCTQKSSRRTWEIIIFFDEDNGLRPGESYEIVMMGIAKQNPLAFDPVVLLFPMEDIVSNPYRMIEAGRAPLNKALLEPARHSAGFTILGGSGALQEVRSALDIRGKLAGEQIIGGTILRLFMLPLTQWDMTSPVSAACMPQAGASCGTITECVSEEVSVGSRKNVVKIRLPPDMTPISSSVRHILRVHTRSTPAAGFFATRILVQLTTPGDLFPDFTESAGDLLWKEPSAGLTVGEVVIRDGIGNNRPFQGDSLNTLFLHLRLGATLRRSEVRTHSASLRISLPQGYKGIRVFPAPLTLPIFSGADSPGSGSPFAHRWVCSEGACSCHLQANDMIPAGTDLALGIVVNNPVVPLRQGDESNRWDITLSSTGEHSSEQRFSASPFQSTAASLDFGSSVSVLGILTDCCLQPTDFRVSPTWGQPVLHNLFIFFRAGESISSGYVLVEAPDLFDFGHPCLQQELPENYYSWVNSADDHHRTWPLPNPKSCISTAKHLTLNQASIYVAGALRAQRRYGFLLEVANPSAFVVSHLTSWRIYTADAAHQRVEGTFHTLSFDPAQVTLQSWGVCQHGIHGISIRLSSMKPYSLTERVATITVAPVQTGVDIEASLRILAPEGYKWTFADADFLFYPSSVAGVTADFPGGFPNRDGNVLTWPNTRYLAVHKYGFVAKIRVPDSAPHGSSNAYFLQFSYNEDVTSSTSVILAARVEAQAIRTLQNPEVGYSTNIHGEVNYLRFQIELVTDIPNTGGILIQGPDGFDFPSPCQPEATHVGNASFLPQDVTCQFRSAMSAGTSEFLIKAGSSGIKSGLLAFQVRGFNPGVLQENLRDENSRCGWSYCWHFYSVKDAKEPLTSPQLDARASTPGFSIKERMAHARLAPFGPGSTGRDDRPLRPNQLVFNFGLTHDGVENKALVLLRGPAGFNFDDMCQAIFGLVANSNRPSWTGSIPVQVCFGSESTARLEVGTQLSKAHSYFLAIWVQSNPPAPVKENRWVIETDLESSQDFDGFDLATFTAASVRPLQPSVRFHGFDYVNVTFRPAADVQSPGGALVLTAPPGFQLFQPTWECPLLLEVNWDKGPASPFPRSEVKCITGARPEVLALEPTGMHNLAAGRQHTLVVHVANPSRIAAASEWQLESFVRYPDGAPLDLARLPGFPVGPSLRKWDYSSTHDLTGHGGSSEESVLLDMRFNEAVSAGDEIIIVAPSGFNLSDPMYSTHCRKHRWMSDLLSKGIATECNGRVLTITVGDRSSIPAGVELQLSLNLQNPPVSPPWAENFWCIRHHSASGAILAADAFSGWMLLPRLQEVEFGLARAVPAGSVGTLHISFVAVSSAASMEVNASGFRFDEARPSLPGQNLSSSSGTVIRCGVSISPRVRTTVQLTGVGLPGGGGEHLRFDLITFTLQGNVADRTLGVHGFRLPGRIDLINASLHHRERGLPFQVGWELQEGHASELRLLLSLSAPILQGHLLKLFVQGLVMRKQDFRLVDATSDRTIPTVVSFTDGGALYANVEGSLDVDTACLLHITVIGKSTRNQSWRVEVSDGGALPVSLSPQIATSFHFVHQFALVVSAQRAPPMATVEVTLQISFGGAVSPSTLSIAAPPGFSFPAECLVSGWVSSCSPGDAMAEHSTAKLMLSRAPDETPVKLLVTTPITTPSTWVWFVEGVSQATGSQIGWGDDKVGLEVQHMRHVNVQYGGVPDDWVLAVISFHVDWEVERGGQIQFLKPPEYDAECSAKLMSLPSLSNCEVRTSEVVLTLDGTLQLGEHATSLMLRTPHASPDVNVFSLLLLDKHQAVQDAAVNLPGQNIFSGLPVRMVPLHWTSTEPGQASSVTLGFEAWKEIPFNTVGKVLITFPEDFTHSIERDCGIKMERSNGTLPLLDVKSDQCGSLDISSLDRVLIHLDTDKIIPAGKYGLRIPVTVPEKLPTYNVWLVTFCAHTSRTCLDPHGMDALMTFPLVGFSFGDIPHDREIEPQGSWCNPAEGSSALLVVLLCLVMSRGGTGP